MGNTNIQGNLSISRNLNIGNNADVKGNATVEHHLTVKGWLEAPNIKGPLKGLYKDEATLKATYPDPEPGWFALVGNTLPADVWRAEVTDGKCKWTKTGEKGGQLTVYLDQIESDLAEHRERIIALEDGMDEVNAWRVDFANLVSVKFKALDDKDKALEEADMTEKTLREAGDAQLKNDLTQEISDRTKTNTKHDSQILELQQGLWPLEADFAANKTVIEVGVETDVTFTWAVKRKGADVTAKAATTLDGIDTLGTKTMTKRLMQGAAMQTIASLHSEYEGMHVTKRIVLNFVYPTYFGTVSKDWEPTEGNIKSLMRYLQTSQAATFGNIATTDGLICYCYPGEYNYLTSVKDGNGYEVLNSYTHTYVSVDGRNYHCYLLTVPMTATGVTQIYK